MGMLMRRHRTGATTPDALFPDGNPDASWKTAELKAYATAHGIDLGGARKKDDVLALLVTSTPPAAFDPAEHTVEEVQAYLDGLDDTDPEARDVEIVRVIEAEKAGQNRPELIEATEGVPDPVDLTKD